MDSWLAEIWDEIVARPSGRMAFRFYFQPIMAMVLAVRDGVRDAREGRPAYFWALFTGHVHRGLLLRDAWRSLRKVFVFALILDTTYQLIVLRGLRPIQGLLVAITLAFIPYVLLRGPANRLTRTVLRTIRRRRSTA